MQTITVKYLGPTNHKPSRYKATCEGGSVTLSTDHECGSEQNCMRACFDLMLKMKWTGKMIGGHTKQGMVFVFTKYPYNVEVPK